MENVSEDILTLYYDAAGLREALLPFDLVPLFCAEGGELDLVQDGLLERVDDGFVLDLAQLFEAKDGCLISLDFEFTEKKVALCCDSHVPNVELFGHLEPYKLVEPTIDLYHLRDGVVLLPQAQFDLVFDEPNIFTQ